MKELQSIVRALDAKLAYPTVLATLVTAEGSSYRRPGARLLIKSTGETIGSISGGCLEEDVLARARKVAATGRAETVVYDTTNENDLVWGVGLGCHGVVRVLIERLDIQPTWAAALAENFRQRRSTDLEIAYEAAEPADLGTRLATTPAATNSPPRGRFLERVPPPTALAIFGAGDDARPLVRLAKELGWHVTVADPRPAAVTATRFPEADRLFVGPADRLVEQVAPDAATLAVVMTHHYVHDVPLIRALLPRPLAYLGLLGPRKRAEKILADLQREGLAISAEQRARLHAPVGFDLGADAPEQVALAIVAEMQAVLTGREGGSLRRRVRPIHG